MAEITFQNVWKRYPDGFEAVKDMNLEIGDGEFMILVGPSGCGKSTALRMVAGLEDITDGELVIGGERVNELAPRDRDIAMVFQNYALYPHMTVAENIGFALRMRKVPKAEAKRKRELSASKKRGDTETLERLSDAPLEVNPVEVEETYERDSSLSTRTTWKAGTCWARRSSIPGSTPAPRPTPSARPSTASCAGTRVWCRRLSTPPS